MDNPIVSIIIRTKNEEKWISACLSSVFSQIDVKFEVIIVDNLSTDKTVNKVKNWPIKLITIDEFKPGKAINLGIDQSIGKFIVCLSGHCIPTNNRWLKNLVSNINGNVVAVYGKQEPLNITSPLDRRDLYVRFGTEEILQTKDYFFHNANSAFLKNIWDKFKFNNSITNIEDRVWAKNVIDHGFNIKYVPNASVFHYHGINHELNYERAKNIVEIIEQNENIILKSFTDIYKPTILFIPCIFSHDHFDVICNTIFLNLVDKDINYNYFFIPYELKSKFFNCQNVNLSTIYENFINFLFYFESYISSYDFIYIFNSKFVLQCELNKFVETILNNNRNSLITNNSSSFDQYSGLLIRPSVIKIELTPEIFNNIYLNDKKN